MFQTSGTSKKLLSLQATSATSWSASRPLCCPSHLKRIRLSVAFSSRLLDRNLRLCWRLLHKTCLALFAAEGFFMAQLWSGNDVYISSGALLVWPLSTCSAEHGPKVKNQKVHPVPKQNRTKLLDSGSQFHHLPSLTCCSSCLGADGWGEGFSSLCMK